MQGIHFIQRIPVIIRILQPVEHLIVHLMTLPLGRQLNARCKLLAKAEGLFPIVPAQEIKAQAGGRVRRLRHGTGSHKHRIQVATASRIKGEPMALLHIGVQYDICILQRHGAASRHLFVRVIVPTGNAFVCGSGEGYIRGADARARQAFLSNTDRTILIQEEHIVDLFEACIQTDGLALCVAFHHAKAAKGFSTFLHPARKLVAFLFRASRRVQGIPVCHDLRIHLLVPIIELEGNVYALIRLYHTERLH